MAPGSMTSTRPSFSNRTHAWPNFVSRIRLTVANTTQAAPRFGYWRKPGISS